MRAGEVSSVSSVSIVDMVEPNSSVDVTTLQILPEEAEAPNVLDRTSGALQADAGAEAVEATAGYGTAARVVFILIEDMSGASFEDALLTPNAIPAMRSLVFRGTTGTNVQCVLNPRWNWLSVLLGHDDDRPSGIRASDALHFDDVIRTRDPFWVQTSQATDFDVATSTRQAWLDDYLAPTVGTHFVGATDAAVALAAIDHIDMTKPDILLASFAAPREAAATFSPESKEYAASLEEVDGYIGEILDTLSRNGMTDDTLVVVTGNRVPNSSGTDGATLLGDVASMDISMRRVPVIFAGPGVKAGVQLPQDLVAPIHMRDFAPTLLNAIGLDAPPTMTGHPILGLYGINDAIRGDSGNMPLSS